MSNAEKIHFNTLPRFIVIEGIDGAGTTTQSRMLVQALAAAGEPVHLTCEPTDGCIGRLIRQVLAGSYCRITPAAMAHLFAADRYEHVHAPDGGILQHLNSNSWVVTDRYLFSSLAYQGPDVGFQRVLQLNSGIPLPEWVFHLDVPSSAAMQRLTERESLDIYENNDFQHQVSQAYQKTYTLFSPHNSGWKMLDGTQSAEKIHAEICTALEIPPIS